MTHAPDPEPPCSATDPTGHRVERFDVLDSNGSTAGEARLVSTTADGLDPTTVLPLEEENGTWRPCT